MVAGSNPVPRSMVSVAQLVERWTVAPVVGGSSPLAHPSEFILISQEKAGDKPPRYSSVGIYLQHALRT